MTARLRAAGRSPILIWTLALVTVFEALDGAGVAVVRSRSPRRVNVGAVGDALPGPGTGRAPQGDGVAPPLYVDIPSLGVRASVIRLNLRTDGSLDVPGDFGVAGWWSGGAAPGSPGPAVVVGHVDSFRGPAVFYRLSELTPGELVSIERTNGSSVTFTVEAVEQFPKQDLPTDLIYGPTDGPTLRLITCGGKFDRAHGRYEDNVVVFARLADGGGSSAAAPPALPSP